MFALIAAKRAGDAPKLLATARTLKAIQRKWDEVIDGSKHDDHLVGLLTPEGFRNYFNKPITPAPLAGCVVATMDIKYGK